MVGVLGAVLVPVPALWLYISKMRQGAELAMVVCLLIGILFLWLLPYNSRSKAIATAAYIFLMGVVLFLTALAGECGFYHSCM